MRFNLTRRTLLKASAAGLGATILPIKFMKGQAWAVNNSDRLGKWMQNLRGLGPGGIPVMSGTPDPVFANTTMYNITVGEFQDKLHPNLPLTTLWGYWDTNNPGAKAHLGGVILARRGTASRLRFTNILPPTHIIPADLTVMVPGTAYSPLLNRTATHLHGGYVPWVSDGGPFDWFSPTGASGLSFPNGPGSVFDNPLTPMSQGQADYFYPNDQSARLMWYHDHAYGITRINAYAGIATAYLLLDAVNDAYVGLGKIPGLPSTIPLVFQDKIFVSSTTPLTDPSWAGTALVPAVAQPRVQTIGSLWYEHVYDPKVFKMATGKDPLTGVKYLAPPPNPSCIPEFFGDTMLCNGTVYPLLTVEAKRYRFFILNACNARFLNINLLQIPPGTAEVPTDPKTLLPNLLTNPVGPKIVQIGNEAGFLATETSFPNGLFFNPATLTGNLLLGTAERADIIIDFTGKQGQEFILYNDAPGPFPVGPPTNDYFLGNPKNPVQPLAGTGPDTRNILKIKVTAAAVPDPQPAGAILTPGAIDPASLVTYTYPMPVPIPPLTPKAGVTVNFTRNLTLNEDFDQYGRLRQLLGTTTPNLLGKGFGLEYLAPPTETPTAFQTEVWNIYNTTADTHPIHFHLVNVQVMSRQPFKMVRGLFTPSGAARGPEPNEVGWKETVQMHPGEVTSVIMRFDLPAVPFTVVPSPRTGNSEYVWHCHILEHEEHDMMRPLVVTGAYPRSMNVTPLAASVNGAIGGTATFNITGGTAPYTVTPVGLAPSASVLGSVVTVPVAIQAPTPAGSPDVYTIKDSAAPQASVNVSLTIT